MTRHRLPLLRIDRRAHALGAAILVLACATVPARAAETAVDVYKKALAREEALRTAPAPPLQAFRATVAAYEDVVLKFYASGFCDNALWQAAGVATTAYERFGDDADRRTGLRLLAWLKKEYPASAYVKHVDERMKALAEPPAPLKPVASGPATLSSQSSSTNAATADKLLPQPAPPSATTSGSYTLGRQLGLGVSRIVIDAGHGGHDPGAQANGVTEAELTLDVAKRLQTLLLNRPGTEVVLTRGTDEFIPLQERTAIANREGADLFLSIHANASPQPIARGVETYFLNFSTTHEAEAVAARENETSARTMGNLPELVKSITLNNKLAESRELAGMVQTAMVKRLKPQNATIRDLGVKQAPFVVLIGAQMPSVLAEISFLTNRSDATLLKQPAYRQRIAQALFDAVVNYQAALKKVVTLAGKDRNR